MSTQSIASAPVGGFAVARDIAPAAKPTKGFFRRVLDAMIASRQAEANRLIQQYVSQLSERDRKDLGFPAPGDRTGR